MSFFNELKRRNVFKVGIAYLIVSWLIVQVADVMIDNIGAPDWLFQAIILVLGLGFPVVLIFAWAFELTPEGLKREKDVDRSQSIAPQTGQKLNYAIMAVMALALGYFAWDKFSKPESEQTVELAGEQVIDKSIAVLPFVNMSPDQDNEYFSDGLSEELLNLLAKVDGLKVAARTSSFKFKNSEEDIAEIGLKLNVATILEGSVRRAGNQARITAQLIKVDDGFHLWSETYDRDLDNIFEVQDEIARAIVDALKLPLLGQDEQVVKANTSSSFEAYDLYLLGRHHEWQINKEGFEKAVDYYTRAVAIDPEFAPGWSGLAKAYLGMADYGDLATEESHALAEDAIERAQALAPEAAETLSARADQLSYRGRPLEAIPLYERALTQNPNDVSTMISLAGVMNVIDPARAEEFARKAYELDPLAEITRTALISMTAASGNREGAVRMARQMLQEDPDNPGLYEGLANVHMSAGEWHLAIPAWEETWRLRPGDVLPATMISRSYLFLEDPESAREWVAKARERGPDSRWTSVAELVYEFDQQAWETQADMYRERIEARTLPPAGMVFYGDTLQRLGRAAEAESLYRRVTDSYGEAAAPIEIDSHADATKRLVDLLPGGEERTTRLEALRNYSEHLVEVRSWDHNTWANRADLAMLEGDTAAAMTYLEKAFELGRSYRKGLEYHPLYVGLADDPAFRTVLARMSEKASEQRALLEAARSTDTSETSS